MINFLVANIVTLVVFLACSVALYPDPDHDDNQKKNTLLDPYLQKSILVPYQQRVQPPAVPLRVPQQEREDIL
jgi:hypothetical protein